MMSFCDGVLLVCNQCLPAGGGVYTFVTRWNMWEGQWERGGSYQDGVQ